LIDKGITITKEGSNLMVYSKKCNIAVEWDGRAKLTLIIPERFGPFVEGICGNCDGTVDPEILLDGTFLVRYIFSADYPFGIFKLSIVNPRILLYKTFVNPITNS
jgi:hypothetical protein